MAQSKSRSVKGELHDSFFDDVQFSDVTVKFGPDSIKAHKVILARGSEYFKKMLCGQFAEAERKEIELSEDDPIAVRAMMRFLYNMDYDSQPDTDIWSHLSCHASVYVTAEKYGLDAFRMSAWSKMTSQLSRPAGLTTNDLIATLELIWTLTTDDDQFARPSLVTYCVSDLADLSKDARFVEFMRNTDLGAEMCLAMEAARGLQSRDLETDVGFCVIGGVNPACYFKQKAKTRLQKAMVAYSSRYQRPFDSYRFHFVNKVIEPDDTPQSLLMPDGSFIVAHEV